MDAQADAGIARGSSFNLVFMSSSYGPSFSEDFFISGTAKCPRLILLFGFVCFKTGRDATYLFIYKNKIIPSMSLNIYHGIHLSQYIYTAIFFELDL